MKPLYQLTAELSALMDAEGEEADRALDKICQDIATKGESINRLLRNIESDVERLKSEENRLKAVRQTLEKRYEHIEEYIKGQMLSHDLTKIGTAGFMLKVSPTRGRVEIDDESKIPATCKKIETKVTYDKEAIRAEIEAGRETGCHIEEGYSLRLG
jgi:hypothetical protein